MQKITLITTIRVTLNGTYTCPFCNIIATTADIDTDKHLKRAIIPKLIALRMKLEPCGCVINNPIIKDLDLTNASTETRLLPGAITIARMTNKFGKKYQPKLREKYNASKN